MTEPSDAETREAIGYLPYRMPRDARTWLTAILRDAAIQGWDVDECGRRATGLLADWQKNDAGPQVFFPGDTVPGGTGVMDETGGGGRRFGWNWVANYVYVEAWIPTREEWQATVDQAKVARGLA